MSVQHFIQRVGIRLQLECSFSNHLLRTCSGQMEPIYITLQATFYISIIQEGDILCLPTPVASFAKAAINRVYFPHCYE